MAKQLRKFVNSLIEKYPQIKSVIQFGSSVSGDYIENLSDIDLAIIVKSKKFEKPIQDFIFKRGSYGFQIHIFTSRHILKSLRDSEPLSLSILYTGKALYGDNYYSSLRKRNFKPNEYTKRRCLSNSFAALGLGISDLTHGMLYDSVNSIYHSARSSIWAILLPNYITPSNAKIFRLIKDKKTVQLYKKIIDFRQNIPNYNADWDFSEKLYKGFKNEFTQLLDNATTLINMNYKKIFNKSFIGFFELIKILRKKFITEPKFYSIMLFVNWEKEVPFYHIYMAFDEDKRVLLNINANTGSIKTLK